MPDYSKGKIYAIRAPGTDSVYIGSTTQSLSQRMAHHRSTHKSDRVSCTSTKILDLEGAYIELIEEYACETREQLNKREGELIRSTPNCINRCVAGQTKQEYYIYNKETAIESAKNNYITNRDTRIAQMKEYDKTHRERKNELARKRYHAKKHTTV